MTNAEMHVAALLAAFGPLPITFETLGARVTGLDADGNVLRVSLVDLVTGLDQEWIYPDPEVWLPDPGGDVVRYFQRSDEMARAVIGEDGNPVLDPVPGRIDPVAVATPEFARQLERWR